MKDRMASGFSTGPRYFCRFGQTTRPLPEVRNDGRHARRSAAGTAGQDGDQGKAGRRLQRVAEVCEQFVFSCRPIDNETHRSKNRAIPRTRKKVHY